MKLIMKTAIILLLGSAAAFTANSAYSGDLYIEPSVFTLDTKVGDFRGVNITGGANINEYIGLRGTYMIGAEDETYQGVNLSIEQMYSAELVLTLPVTDSFSVYGVGGRTWIEAEASYGGYSVTAKGDATSYGLGLKFAVRESFSVFGEVKEIDGDRMLSAGLRFEL